MKTEIEASTKWYETLTFKMALLGIMAIMFIIPLQLIMMVIRERESTSQIVQDEIAAQWGKTQIITGPVLNIPVYVWPEVVDVNSKPVLKTWHIMPENVVINGKINPQIRYKGIYETVIYDADLDLTGGFQIIPSAQSETWDPIWGQAYLTLGISDNRGIKDKISMLFGGETSDAEPGLKDHDVFQSGISFPVSVTQDDELIQFSLKLGLRGSSGIYFSPVGKTSKVNITSDWDAPSFKGNFLPETRVVDENGFTASWFITNLNRNFPQEWLGYGYSPEEESFGVDLILEVDHYQKSERSAKYGMLFIAFTFLALLFLELSLDKRIHIFNYFLVSLALVLFFSLLNSLGEHIGFNPAYIISAVATITLITLFTAMLIKKRKPVIVICSLLSVLYTFIYVLLVLNQYSSLAGNIGLFIALAAIMRLSARTDLFRKSQI